MYALSTSTSRRHSQFKAFVSTFVPRRLLLKVTMRCDIKCTYCYWFRDPAVYERPAFLTREVEAALLEKLRKHISTHNLRSFSITFHGGEPLLWGKRRFVCFCSKVFELEASTGCQIRLSIQTNGIGIDPEWAALFRIFRASVSISLDGPAKVHDKRRVDFRGRITVPIITLNQIVASSGAGLPEMVKIDAEGFDLKVLAGASNLLGNTNPQIE